MTSPTAAQRRTLRMLLVLAFAFGIAAMLQRGWAQLAPSPEERCARLAATMPHDACISAINTAMSAGW